MCRGSQGIHLAQRLSNSRARFVCASFDALWEATGKGKPVRVVNSGLETHHKGGRYTMSQASGERL